MKLYQFEIAEAARAGDVHGMVHIAARHMDLNTDSDPFEVKRSDYLVDLTSWTRIEIAWNGLVHILYAEDGFIRRIKQECPDSHAFISGW